MFSRILYNSCLNKWFKLNIITEIHQQLEREITEINSLITSNLTVDEELIGIVGKYLVEAGGKRIRPLLTILSSKMFGDKNTCSIKLATAVEFIHTATLLHDDVVDESKMRRFKPTANMIWGNKASILVGDFLFSQSFKLMVASKSIQALSALSNASAVIAQGEVAQLSNLNQRRMLSFAEYEQVVTAKTAELFGAACEVGAIIENQPEKICSLMKEFGINLGKIFQMADDLLDYFGNDAETGKNIGDDFAEGKVTLPLIFLYRELEQTNKNKLIRMIEADSRSSLEFTWVKKMLRQHEVKRLALGVLDKLKQNTAAFLNKTPVDNKYRNYLFALVDFAASRSC